MCLKSLSENQFCKLGRGFGEGERGVGGEFFAGAEAPGDTYGADSDIQSGLHIHIGISDIDGLVSCYAGSGGENLVHYLRVRLYGLAVALSENADETVLPEEVGDEFLGSVLVFVRGDGETDAGFREFLKHFRDAIIGPCEVTFVGVIVWQEIAGHSLYILFSDLFSRHRRAEKVVDATADHLIIFIEPMFRETALTECVIARITEVRRSVQQRTVKVKNSKFHHNAAKLGISTDNS